MVFTHGCKETKGEAQAVESHTCWVCHSAGPFGRTYQCTFKMENRRHTFVLCKSHKCEATFVMNCRHAAEKPTSCSTRSVKSMKQAAKKGFNHCPLCFCDLKDVPSPECEIEGSGAPPPPLPRQAAEAEPPRASRLEYDANEEAAEKMVNQEAKPVEDTKEEDSPSPSGAMEPTTGQFTKRAKDVKSVEVEHVSGASRWLSGETVELPVGWKYAWDPETNRVYYRHMNTEEVTWNLPSSAKLLNQESKPVEDAKVENSPSSKGAMELAAVRFADRSKDEAKSSEVQQVKEEGEDSVFSAAAFALMPHSNPSSSHQVAGQNVSPHMVGKSPEVRFAKTKMCKFHIQGKCAKGFGCSFAHGPTEMENSPDLYRTQLCMALVKTGHCKESDTCRYAHSKDQLRAAPPKDPALEGAKGGSNAPKRQLPNKISSGADAEPQRTPLQLPRSPPPSPAPAAVPMWMTAVPVLGGHIILPGSPSGMNSPMLTGVMTPFGLQCYGPGPYNVPYTGLANPPPAVVKQTRFNSTPFPSLHDSRGLNPWTDNLSETSTDGSTDTPDKFTLDGFSLDGPGVYPDGGGDSLRSSIASCEVAATLSTPKGDNLRDFGVEGFNVSIKNTFLDVSPKSSPCVGPARRVSRSVPR